MIDGVTLVKNPTNTTTQNTCVMPTTRCADCVPSSCPLRHFPAESVCCSGELPPLGGSWPLETQ